jgi:copper chaperone
MTSTTSSTPANDGAQVFTVQGMTCGHCERAVTQAVQSVDSAATVRIDRSTGRVEVNHTSAARAALASAIAEEGYAVAP